MTDDRYAHHRRQSEARKKASRYDGMLDHHEPILIRLIEDLLAKPPRNDVEFDRAVRRHPKEGGSFSKSDIVQAWRRLAKTHGWDDDHFVERLRMKPVRTQSGVAPVTVLTRPHPCPGRCVFCPSDTRMPKSYLSMEPGAQRGTQHGFDPFWQTFNRLRAFHNNGHRVDKVELILLGGTFSSYPHPYQRWFIQGCLDAMNQFGELRDANQLDEKIAPSPTPRDFLDLTETVDGANLQRNYNEVVTSYLRERTGAPLLHHDENAAWEEVELAQRINETGKVRCVGLSIETRPDCVDEAEVTRIRRLGATKVQIGIQSLDDAILATNQRGHDVATARRSVGLLRRAGFKVQAHWMPNLMGSTPTRDRVDFQRLFSDPAIRPDELKIYPTCLIDSAELMTHHRRGAWQPYTEEGLIGLLEQNLLDTPRYCRINRVIRDIPSHDIEAGNRVSNLRETVERRLAARGVASRDIRHRQIRRALTDADEVRIESMSYDSDVGVDHFIEGVTERDELVGFARLFLPHRAAFLDELGDSAILREVHVYGAVAAIGVGSSGEAQHRGIGQRVIAEGERIARDAGFRALAVISAIGTRDYYRRLGFVDGPLYLTKPIV